MTVGGEMLHLKPQIFQVTYPVSELTEVLSSPAVEGPIDQKMGEPLPFRVRGNILHQQKTSFRKNTVTVFEQLILLGVGEMVEHIADYGHIEFRLVKTKSVLELKLDTISPLD